MPVLRLKQGELRDEIRQPIYDTITLTSADSAVATRRFFSSVQGKPLSQTNLRQNNLLETAVSYRCLGLAFDAQNIYAANINLLPVIMENSSLKLQVGEKQYWQGNAVFLAGRIEQFSALYGQAAPTERLFQRFGAQAVAPVVFEGRHAVDINPLQTFYVEWVVDALDATDVTNTTLAASTKARFIASLKGIMRRPVQ